MKQLAIIQLLVFLPVAAQTQLDLRSQSRNVDFGSALSTRPIKTGDTLPNSCAIGELFFRTSIVAGKNLYGCTAANTWTSQSVSVSPSGVPKYTVTFTAQTSITITAAMHGFDSPDLLVTCYNGSSPALLLSPDGVSVANSSLEVHISFAAPRTGRCILNGPGSAYGSGEGIVQSGTEFAVDTASVPSFLTGQAAFSSWPVPGQSCVDRPLPLVGAGVMNTVVAGWPPTLPSSISGSMFVSASGTVTIRLCNVSAGAITVPALTFSAAIIKSF